MANPILERVRRFANEVVAPRDTPGVEIVKRWELIGLRSSATNQVALEDRRVPARNALAGSGLRVLEVGLNATRTLIATMAVGMARQIRDLCIDYARSKPLRGATLEENPVIAAKLGQMEMQIEVMHDQCLSTARKFASVMSALMRQPSSCDSAQCARRWPPRCSVGRPVGPSHPPNRRCSVGWDTPRNRSSANSCTTSVSFSIVEGGEDVIRELIFNRFLVPMANGSRSVPGRVGQDRREGGAKPCR